MNKCIFYGNDDLTTTMLCNILRITYNYNTLLTTKGLDSEVKMKMFLRDEECSDDIEIPYTILLEHFMSSNHKFLIVNWSLEELEKAIEELNITDITLYKFCDIINKYPF